ncbi:MAG TPA: CopD family protein, partial [Steroidobacter sp.]|nr:CopD family protein [Steroidobacter sp.]
MDLLGIFVAVVRGLHLAAVMSAFGCLVFDALVWNGSGRSSGDAATVTRPASVDRLLRISLNAAILTAVPWLLLQSAWTSGAETITEAVAAAPLVATSTTFGQSLLLRFGLLGAAVALQHRRPSTSRLALLGIVGAALALQSGVSHAIAQDDWYLLATHALHVVAAGAWLGSLLPLWLSLQGARTNKAGRLLVRFSFLGMLCVTTLLLTAYAQFVGMIGGLPPLVGTTYGHLALAKGMIFVVLLLCAAVNRMVWTPRQLNARTTAASSRGLKLTIAIEFLAGLTMVAMASSLASTPPALHEQPSWPFSVQFDIAGFYHPPMWDKIERSLAAVVAALLLGGVGFLVQRFVWVPFVAASAFLLAAPFPKTDILFKPAHRTTFYVSPSTFPVASIARGDELFVENCARCHDPRQRAMPRFSKSMPVVPPALHSSRVAQLRDGNLFWGIAHGVDDPRGGKSMPGFASVLSDDDIWSVIDYLRALAARSRGQAVREVAAPSFNANCPDGNTLSLTELRGKVVRLAVANGNPIGSLSARFPSETVVLARDPDASLGWCTVQELEAWSAYAVIAGVEPKALPGTVFLIDANGWLRYSVLPDTMPEAEI